jgi:hypothetical protein
VEAPCCTCQPLDATKRTHIPSIRCLHSFLIWVASGATAAKS